jgi:hypothetical protein
MAMPIQSGEISRVGDLYDEPVDSLLVPLRGYEDQPLLPLNETIKPISRLFNRIEDYAFIALHNSQNPTDGLDQQESASIHLYTMQFGGGSSLYQLLNQSLRKENRDELKPWFLFLKLFLTALYKLPSQNKIVWRGIKNVDLSSKYKKGTKFAWWGVSSCSTNIEILESIAFLGKTGERTIFSIECIHGKSIVNHSYFKTKEDEVILMPGSYFEVIGQVNPTPQLHIIQLKQITPPITLLEPPFLESTNNNSSSVINQSNTNSSSTSNIIKQNKSSNVVSKQMTLKSSMIYFHFLKYLVYSLI